MDLLDRLRVLSSEMQHEPAEDFGCPPLSLKQQSAINISHAQLPNGKQIRLLKTLQTSACERGCFYCPFRAGRDFRRTTLNSDEMASAFMTLESAGVVEGMFLSSGVAGGSRKTQDEIIKTAEILRAKYRFTGYLHLKLMPGAEEAQIQRTMELADRVSINLEAPNTSRLSLLAPEKTFFDELLQPLLVAEKIRRQRSAEHAWRNRWPSLTTQFVVSAVGENDIEMLSTTEEMYRNYHLSRAYYSSFHPISGTPFEGRPPSPPERVLRLYQASFLLRDYGFTMEEMPFEEDGNLPAHVDPKTAWAQSYLQESPVDINIADRRELLRVPGIGPKGANAIIAARRLGKLRSIEDISRLGIRARRVVPYILLDGKRPDRQLAFDLSL